MEGKKTQHFLFSCLWIWIFILNTKDKLSKFDPKSDPGIFLGYSSISKAYRVFDKKTQAVEETIHISFTEKKNDLNENVADLEEEMENMSLNDNFQN